MHVLRWKETRPLPSLIAVGLWSVAMWVLMPFGRNWLATPPAEGAALLLCAYAMCLPFLALALPVMLCCIAQYAGRVTAIVCAAATIGWWGTVCGGQVALAVVLLLVPGPLFALYSYERKLPFWRSVLIGVALLYLGAMATLSMANAACGGDAVAALRDLLLGTVGSADDRRLLLGTMASFGLLQIPESILPALKATGSTTITPGMESEWMKQFSHLMETLLRDGIPTQMVRCAMISGLLSVALPRHQAAKQAQRMELAPIPPYHAWYIPTQIGYYMAGAFAASLLLMLMSQGPGMLLLFRIVWAAISCALAVQGGSVLVFIMRRNGSRRTSRILAVVALAVFLNAVLIVLGLADQLLNLRRLRVRPEHARDEEDER